MFDWQTDETAKEQEGWDEPLPEPVRSSRPGLRQYWRLIAVVGLLVMIVGLVIWRQVQQATQVTQAEVISSVNLVHRAVENGDEELFRSLLSGRSRSWTQATLRLFERDLLFDRQQLGMVVGPLELPLAIRDDNREEQATTAAVDISLSPDLREAEVVGAYPYIVARGESFGGLETVWLRQTAVYRRGDQGWLLSPPLSSFWGEWQTLEGERLDLIYPERDAATAERLAADLDALLVRACSQLTDLDCPATWDITLRLENETDILLELAERRSGPVSGSTVELPTPTLVGLPVTEDESAAEAGYQALLRMYGSWLLRSAIAELTGFECCQQMLFYQALVDYLLNELGEGQWVVTPDDYGRLLAQRVHIRDLEDAWRLVEVPVDAAGAEQQWQVYVLVDYLLRTLPEPSAAEMIRWLGRTDSLQDWLQNVLMRQPEGDRAELTRRLLPDFDRHWWAAAYQIAERGEEAAPEQFSSSLYASCISDRTTNRWRATLSRLEPGSSTMEPLYEVGRYLRLLSIPGDDGLWLQEFGSVAGGQLKRWENRHLMDVALNIEDVWLPTTFDEVNPIGQFGVVYAAREPNGTPVSFLTYLLDFGRCEDNTCSAIPTAGPIRWSPEGNHALLVVDDYRLSPMIITWGRGRWQYVPNLTAIARHPLYLGSGTEVSDVAHVARVADAELIGEGYGPFWIDEQNYGFLRVRAPGEQEVALGEVGGMGWRPLISTSDLNYHLPEADVRPRLELIQVVAHPTDSAVLFLVALDRATEQGYLFSINRHDRQINFRLRTEANLQSLAFSPDGRYLVVTDFDERGAGSSPLPIHLFLHDIEDNQTTPFLIAGDVSTPAQAYGWSPDGKWLAFAPGEDSLTLVAPDQGIVRQVAHEYGACNGIVWLDG